MELGVALIIVAAVLFAVGILLQRQRSQQKAQVESAPRRGRAAPPAEEDIDLVRPRPRVVEMHVRGDEARVIFDVPVPDEEDEVLSELLVHEAIEVVREKRHTLPMAEVTAVVAYAGRGVEPREVGRANLATPGQLPPATAMPSLLNLSHIAADPLDADFDERVGAVPGTVAPTPEDRLPPLRDELRIPRAVETGLRAQGIDPQTMSAGELVTGMLALVGYQVTPGIDPNSYTATKGGQTTFIRSDPYKPGDHPELDSDAIRRFLIEFQGSRADKGLLVTEKYGPFEVYEKERREPRVRFITRERLQKMVDALSLG